MHYCFKGIDKTIVSLSALLTLNRLKGDYKMAWNFCSGKPIYPQIADRIAIDIVNGRVLPSQRLPEVGDMSKITGASESMVMKAYDLLTECGIIEKYGSLFIVKEDLTAAKARRRKLALDCTNKFLEDMHELGMDN